MQPEVDKKQIQVQNLFGWYAEKEDIQKEIAEIAEAVKSGKRTHQLKYCCKVTSGGISLKIIG